MFGDRSGDQSNQVPEWYAEMAAEEEQAIQEQRARLRQLQEDFGSVVEQQQCSIDDIENSLPTSTSSTKPSTASTPTLAGAFEHLALLSHKKSKPQEQQCSVTTQFSSESQNLTNVQLKGLSIIWDALLEPQLICFNNKWFFEEANEKPNKIVSLKLVFSPVEKCVDSLDMFQNHIMNPLEKAFGKYAAMCIKGHGTYYAAGSEITEPVGSYIDFDVNALARYAETIVNSQPKILVLGEFRR